MIHKRHVTIYSVHVIDQNNQMNLMNIKYFIPVTGWFEHEAKTGFESS